jgi:hypothetical protein
MQDWTIGVTLALFVIVPCWLAMLRRKETKRQADAWSELARHTGMTYSPGYPPSVHGEYRGHNLSIALITYGDLDRESIIYQNASISLSVQNSACCSLSIQGKSILDYIGQPSEVSSGNLDFDSRFTARGSPCEYVQEAVELIARREPRLLKWILWHLPSINLKGDTLSLSQNSELTNVDDQLALLDLACDLTELTEKMGGSEAKCSEGGKE